jgi:hypothetical protein
MLLCQRLTVPPAPSPPFGDSGALPFLQLLGLKACGVTGTLRWAPKCAFAHSGVLKITYVCVEIPSWFIRLLLELALLLGGIHYNLQLSRARNGRLGK